MSAIFDFLFRIPVPVLAVIFFGLIWLAEEFGYRRGVVRARREADRPGNELGVIQGAVLGLLGLLLAFTYSLAANRYDTRKQVLMQEANAIGTAYLRCDLIPEPARTQLRSTFRQYVSLRIAPETGPLNAQQREAVMRTSEQLHNAMWTTVTRVARDRSPNPLDTLVISAVNDVIDLHTARVTAYEDHVPGIVIGLVLLVAMLSMALTGFACGVSHRREWFFTMTLSVLIVAVTVVIIDLDRSHQGFIQVSQKSMIELQHQIEKDFGILPTTQQ